MQRLAQPDSLTNAPGTQPALTGTTRNQLQARRLTLPGRDILLADGRKLREIIGYKEHVMSLVAIDEATKKSLVAMRGWRHLPTDFVVSASIGLNPDAKFNALLHVSMSYPDHDPSWEEIKLVRAIFFPKDVDAMMMLPRESNYVNRHQFCYHLWQCPDEWTVG